MIGGHGRGFTLVELLIAISLTAMMAVVAYGGLHLAGRGWAGTARVVDANDEARVAWSFLRARLAQARPVLGVDDDQLGIEFDGEPGRLRFIAPAPVQQEAFGGLYAYVLEIADGVLWLDYGLYLPGGDERRLEEPRVLLAGVDGRRGFSYFGALQAGEERRWHDHWDRRDALPERVRLDVWMADSGMSTWVMPVRAGGGR